MAKLRVHELAKKVGLKNADLIEKLKAAGIAVKTHSSSVDEASAMKALGNGAEKKDAAPKKSRPRTMVRRRRGGAEEPAAEAVEETVVVADAPLAEPAVVVETPVEPEHQTAVVIEAPAVEAPAVAAATDDPVVDTPAAEASAPAVVATPAVDAPAPATTPAEQTDKPAATAEATASTAEKPAEGEAKPASPDEPKPSNVVRVIDPNAIKQRLAAEGRTFKPPQRNRFSPRREIRVVNDRSGGGPRLVDVTNNTGGPGGTPGGGARPGRGNKRPGGGQNYRDRREARAAGRDIWFNPGKKRKSGKKGKGPEITQAAAHKRVVEIADVISVNDLAHKMSVKAGQVIGKLMGMGMMVTMNQTIDFDTAAIVATEFGYECKNVAVKEEDLLDRIMTTTDESEREVQPRAPVVTVMGHVDHGKTSLLDHIRNANVVSGEAGGITQHIGAYSVETKKGRVTFLDTPGHEAFTAMRARGADVTDIVILVVAADDGVMPQTKEAIKHAKDSEVPLVVAINKCDKPDARPERVMQELTEHGLVPEEWGGETQMVQVSALKGEGIEGLLDALLLQSEILELAADPDERAVGAIVEAQLDKGRGPVATVLVQTGTLRQGDFIVAGEHHGKVRAMTNSLGESVKEAGPSMPVAVLGLGGVPNAGDQLNSVPDDKTAKRVAEHRSQKSREAELQQTSRVSLENFLATPVSTEEKHEVRLVVKADVDGSVEALRQALVNLKTKKVDVSIVQSGVGTITENDVNLAITSEAIIIGFNAKPDSKASALAQHEGVDVRTYSVIYEALDEVRDTMAGMLAPKIEERNTGEAEVRAVFRVPKLGAIAGSYVTDGKIHRSNKCRVMRGKDVVHVGGIASLKRFKDDVREVGNGFECGIGIEGYNEFEEGDRLQFYEELEVKAELDEALINIEEEAPPEAAAGESA